MRRSNDFWNRKLRESYLGSLLLRFINYIVRLLQHGLFGHFLQSDSDRALETSAICGGLELTQFDQRVKAPAKRRLLEDSESSKLLRCFRIFITTLIRTPAKAYGFFLFAAGCFLIIYSSVTHLYEAADPAFIEKILIGSVCVILSFPLFRMEEPFHLAVKNSLLLSTLLGDLCGVQDSDMPACTFPFQEYLALLLGLGFGSLLSLLGYRFVFSALLLLIFFAITVTKPETGTVLCLLLMAILPAKTLAILLAITLFAFIGKLLIGKRALHFSMLDMSILALLSVLVFSTAFGVVGFLPAHLVSLFIFLAIYFLVANLLDTVDWLKRGVFATLAGISLSALIGILEYITGQAGTRWQDAVLFADLPGRVGSTLGNPNMLAAVLTLVLPIALACTLYQNWSSSIRTLSAVAFLSCGISLILTWSRGGWLGALFGLLIFAMLYTRKTWIFFFSTLALSPLLSFLLPDMVIRRLSSIFNLADSSTSYRIQIWKQSLQMIKDHLFGGIGYGEESFVSMADRYPVPGLTAEAHAHSLYLQLTLSCGIFVLLLLLIFELLLARKVLTFHKLHANSERFPHHTISCAAFSGILGFFVQSFTDHTWYSYRVFCIFWALVGITIASIRAYGHHIDYVEDAQSAYTIDLL